MEQMAKQKGIDPAIMRIEVRTLQPEGSTSAVSKTREVTIADLRAEAAPLAALSRHCKGCSANFLKQPFGCFGAIGYPLPAAAEEWLMERLQLANEFGGWSFLQAITDLHYTGELPQKIRQSGAYERKEPVTKTMSRGLFSKKTVDSNQLLHAIVAVGGSLQPSHCMMVLIWLGVVAFDGRVPKAHSDVELVSRLHKLGAEERRTRTSIQIELSPQWQIAGVQNLLRGMYTAWVEGVPLMVDA